MHGARPGRMHASAPGAALKIPESSNGPPEPFCDRSKLRSARKLGLPDKTQNRMGTRMKTAKKTGREVNTRPRDHC
jgi:hypothetical protein